MKNLLTAVLLLGLAAPALHAQAQKPSQQAGEAYLDSYVEMLRADVRGKKIALITQAIPMTEQESAAFWPVYKKYDTELNQLNDERLGLIKDFAANYQTMTDAKSKELVNRFLAWEENRLKLKRKYFDEFSKVLPPVKAARLVQLENKVNLLIDVQIAAEVPLIQ